MVAPKQNKTLHQNNQPAHWVDRIFSKTKEELYSTAYCPNLSCFVALSKAYQDDKGEWFFVCNNKTENLIDRIFSKSELTEFVL